VHALTEQQVRRSFVNCSQGEAMCLLCQTAQTGDAVALFTARRTGAAGRNGDTVGTYMCADLGCADRVRTEIPAWLQHRNPAEVVAERAVELRERVQGFRRGRPPLMCGSGRWWGI
jgi:hypothetical protein